MNERIRVPQVRLVDEDGAAVGVVDTHEAMRIARERGLDLVEVSPTARPPVCRLMDFGRFRYEQSKKARKAKRKQHVQHLKEVKLRPKIEKHDYDVKRKAAQKFLEAHDKVKVTVTFRGREQSHPELGQNLLERFATDLTDVSTIETRPKHEGRTIIMVLAPRPQREMAARKGAKASAVPAKPEGESPRGGEDASEEARTAPAASSE